MMLLVCTVLVIMTCGLLAIAWIMLGVDPGQHPGRHSWPWQARYDAYMTPRYGRPRHHKNPSGPADAPVTPEPCAPPHAGPEAPHLPAPVRGENASDAAPVPDRRGEHHLEVHHTVPVAYYTCRQGRQFTCEDTGVDLLPVIRDSLGGTSVRAVVDYLFSGLEQERRWAS
jgi:hypothetical protein